MTTASATSVPQIEFTPTGLVVPPEDAVLSGVQEDINGAFGGNMNPSLSTPQGQLASSTSAAISDGYGVFAEFVDQVDPANATGFMQDAIGQIYFMSRNPALPTTVQLACGGEFGAEIIAGTSQARDTSGNVYICTQSGTIPVGGSITLTFQNIVSGPIACPANTVTTIYQNSGSGGWNTVNNPAAGSVGADVETPAAFEYRRQMSVAANSHGSIQAIAGAVFGVPDVLDVFAYENLTGETITYGSTNYQIPASGIFVGVVGGAAQAIANAIFSKKNEGSNMSGNTTGTVVDTNYSYPQPSYTYTWNTNTPTPYNFIVNVVSSSALPSTIVADVTNAISAQFNGLLGVAQANGVIPSTTGQRVRIASLLLAATFYGPVATCEGPNVPVQVLSIYIGSVFVGTGTLVNGSNVLTIASVTSGSLSPGTVVTATDVPAGTTIVQQLSGTTGGVGTYQMSANATATVEAAEAVTGAGGTAQQIGIDQAPQLGSVTVNLIEQ